jgi:ankyrin repeat protein
MALVDAGADINQVSSADLTSPALAAALNGHSDLLIQLVERGADPNLASHDGATPLYITLNTYWAPRSRYPQQQAHQFQKHTYLETMEALLKAGANPNARLTSRLWYMEFTFAQLDLDETGATAFWRAAHGTDLEAMKLLIKYGADPNLGTLKSAGATGRGGRGGGAPQDDPSGLPPFAGGDDVWPIHAASGDKYGAGFAGNSHRHAPDGWLPSVKYLIEELGADVNQRDSDGNTPLHNAASRGDNEMVLYLVEKGADVMAVNRRGQTTADMANGPAARITPHPETIKLLVGLGAVNNNNCRGC